MSLTESNAPTRRSRLGDALAALTVTACVAAAVAAFVALYRLRNDPNAGLGSMFRFAAYLQLIPFAIAAALALVARRRAAVGGTILIAVIACGVYGWWWFSGLEEVRRFENEPVRRRALGNIFPDIESQAEAVKAMLWPLVVVAVIGGAALIACLATRTHKSPARSLVNQDRES
jgi:amino acid transporter